MERKHTSNRRGRNFYNICCIQPSRVYSSDMLRLAIQDRMQEPRRMGNCLRVHLQSFSPKVPRQLWPCPAQCLQGVPLVGWLPTHTCLEEGFLNTILLLIRQYFKYVKPSLQLNDTSDLKAAPKHMEERKEINTCHIKYTKMWYSQLGGVPGLCIFLWSKQ